MANKLHETVRLEVGSINGPGNYIGLLLHVELDLKPDGSGWVADCVEPGVYTDGPGVWHGEGEVGIAAVLDLLGHRCGRLPDGSWLRKEPDEPKDA